MKQILSILLCVTMLLSFVLPATAVENEETGIKVTELKQTSSTYDLGIAADNIRLAWELGGEVRGVYQSAYRLTIRDSEETVYDTGWVESAAQSGIKARNLEPETVYYWTVNVKDQYGNESGFAEEATFETAPDAIGGGWIGNANLVRKEFALEQPLSNVERARSYIGSACPLEIHINGEKVGDLVLSPHKPEPTGENYYNTYDILPYLQDGVNAVGVMLSNAYAMGNSCSGMLKIWYKDGATQTIATGSDWKMTNDSMITRYTWSAGEDIDGNRMNGWDEVGYDDSGWADAEYVGTPVYDGMYHVGESAGMVYASPTFSGDYTIEAGVVITEKIASVLFGAGNPNPAMWQLDAENNTLRIHKPSNWSSGNITVVSVGEIEENSLIDLKIEVAGDTVTTYIGGAPVNTSTLAANLTNGRLGVRTSSSEDFSVDYFRVTQNGETVFEDDFDSLNREVWSIPAIGDLVPAISGTTILEEVAPVAIYPAPPKVDTSKPYVADGAMVFPTNSGTFYTNQSFSGDYAIEVAVQTYNYFGLVFGNGSSYPLMAQLTFINGGQVKMHQQNKWSGDGITSVEYPMDVHKEFTLLRVDVAGNEVTLSVNGEKVMTTTVAAGSTTGPIGIRESTTENAIVDYVQVIQNGEVIFRDDFETIDTEAWTIPAQVLSQDTNRYVVDFGKNMAGYVRVKGRLEQGATMTLAYAELLDEVGNIFPNTTFHFPTCTYTFTGGEDTFEPYFFYTGFRYVEVTCDETPTADMFTACFTSDEVEQTGRFESSSDRLNRILGLYYQSQRSNMLGNYTDCPQREKLGWTGDASVTKEGGSILFGDYATAEAYMRLMLLNVEDNGRPQIILPEINTSTANATCIAWTSAYFTFPYYTYLQTGDPYYIEMIYDELVRVFDYYLSIAQSDGVPTTNRYGDWLGYDNQEGKLDKGALGATYAYYSGTLLSEMAEVIGRDHTELDATLASMYDAMQARYNKGSYWSTNTQTGNSMALDFDLVPQEQHDRIVEALVKNVTDYGSLRTGVLGTMSLYNALSEENYHKELLEATVAEIKCSFGYMLDNGATTMWEYWDRVGEGFNSQGANGNNTFAAYDSQNHCMMGGGLTAWMFQGLGGIRSTGPAYHTITYRPGLESELTWVNSSVDTMIGLTESNWTYENGVLDWTVTVPVNATAKIVIPVEDALVIQESGVNVFCKDGNGLTYVGKEDGAYVYSAGSGTYIFHVSETAEAGSVDVTPITDAIAAANAAMEGVQVMDLTASQVEYGVRFVSAAAAAALDAAIDAAKASVGSVQTEEDVTNAVNALNIAVETYEAAVQTGLMIYVEKIYEAEEAVMGGGTVAASDNVGFSGTGFADYAGKNSYTEFRVNVPEASQYDIVVRYATNGQRSCVMSIHDTSTTLSILPGKQSGDAVWQEWLEETVSNVQLTPNTEQTIRITASGSSGPNLDRIVIRYAAVAGDASAIEAALAAAREAKTGIQVSDLTADQVEAGIPFVSAAVMAALDAAIAEAEAAMETVVTQAEVEQAVETLNTAVETFRAAIQTGGMTDHTKAAAVDALIDAIHGADKAAIDAARAAYEALTDQQKALVTKLAELEAAELAYKTLNTPVALALTGPDRIDASDEEVVYTLSGRDMTDLATMILTFEITDEYLTDAVAVEAEGWYILAQSWKNGRLSVVICNNAGADGEGDILSITAKPTGESGEASVSVTYAELSAYLGEEETIVSADLDAASVTTGVGHLPCDVNKDGVVNMLDMTRAQRFYGTNHADADVNGDGEVNIDDLILILNNYSELFT